MANLEQIAENARQVFDVQTKERDNTLSVTRLLIRHCAHTIRAVHRQDHQAALLELESARLIVQSLRSDLFHWPQIYYAGYTQDALKEFAEASIVFALIFNEPLPSPDDLTIGVEPYLQGLAEAVGELRRRCLDILRYGYSPEAERMMSLMDDIYSVLTTMDYSDAITGGLRRLTDIARSLSERTRGDLTLMLRQSQLETNLASFSDQLHKTYGK